MDKKKTKIAKIFIGFGEVSEKIPEEYIIGLKYCVEEQTIGTSFIQRKTCLPYPRVAKIVDWIIEKGYARVDNGKKIMVISMSDFENLFPEYM